MENEFRKEEKTRKALLRYGGDIDKVGEALQHPIDYVMTIQKKMKEGFQKSPDINLQIAASISQQIIDGRNQRKQILQDMVNSLENREQLWVCAECDTEVMTMVINSDEGEVHHCPKCDKNVNRRYKDRTEIYDQKMSLLQEMRKEDKDLLVWMEKMGFTGIEPPPGPTTVIQNRQQVLVLGDGKVTEKQQYVLDEIKHLPPLEAEKLRQDLKKEMITIDDKIRDAEQRIEKAEEIEEAEESGSDIL